MPTPTPPRFLAVALVAAAFVLVLAAAPARAALVVASDYATLPAAIAAAGPQGQVIVDGTYWLDAPLVLPSRIRLTGTGPQGQGVLAFTMSSGSAITVAGGGDAWVLLETLDIEGLYVPGGAFATSLRGLDLSNASNVYLDSVTVRGFDIGIYGSWSFSVHVNESNVSVNQTYNYLLRDNANSWRITGGLSSQAGDAAIRILHSNDTLIDGVRMESNPVGVHTSTESTHIMNNRFECSPVVPMYCAGAPVAVRVDGAGNRTVLVGNLYAGYTPLDDTTVPSTTYRFDNGFAAAVRPSAGEDGLRVELPGGGEELVYDAQGRLRVGPQQGVDAHLTVNGPAGDEALRVRADGVTRLYVGSTGRVGVGTSVPSEQLHVNGNLRLDGDLVTTGEICIGSGC